MHVSRCRPTEKQQDRLAESFVAGVTARSAANLVSVNHKTRAFFYFRLREIIADQLIESSSFGGKVELDESYFGNYRKGKRGRGASGKVAVFGILKRGGRVYTAVPPDLRRNTLMPIIREKVRADSMVYTDSYAVYDVLDVSEFRRHRINYMDAFVRKHITISMV